MKSWVMCGLALLGVVSWAATVAEAEQPGALVEAGLGAMEELTDGQGASIRGQAFGAAASGMSLVTGLIVDPMTASHVQGTSIQFSGGANAGEGWLYGAQRTISSQTATLAVSLAIQSQNSLFLGRLSGASGLGWAGVR